jgi:hypothetical protein
VVTDFAAFGAPANASVFGTAVASTPFSLAGGKAAFGGIRNPTGRTAFDADADDDDDEGKQRVELREDSISLDQVLGPRFCRVFILTLGQARRITMQSAWRGVTG